MKPDLREALKTKVLVGDGAMGTFLYGMGFPVGISYEELNLLRPDVIMDVHRRYYEAGARLIETNTFSANREKLSKFGLEGEVAAINKAGVELARRAVGPDAYVVGAVGPVRDGRKKNIRTSQVKADMEEQIQTLLECEVDGLLLETFFDLEEMMLALQIIRGLSGVPVICQFATEGGGNTQDGVPLQDAFVRVLEAGADVVGFNCRSGPNGIMRSMEKLDFGAEVPLSAFPNAGIPDYVDGRYKYMATPEYFGETSKSFADAGAKIIGGCCGTTPDHIAAISKALDGYVPNPDKESGRKAAVAAAGHPEPVKVMEPEASEEPSIIELVKQRHTVIVELDPPRDLDIAKFMEGSTALKEACVDAITLADNAVAVTRSSNMALGYLIKEQTGVRPLVHINCRDRNLIGTQSHLMGLHAMGIDHVLAVTGDPARFGDLPGSSSVYDLTSFEIIRMIKQINDGVGFSGKTLKKKGSFVVGAAFNPNVKYLDKAVQRLERKIESGADYIMTQPVYDARLIERLHEATKHLDIPIFIGIMPLASGRNAEFLHNEIPGIQLSDEIRQRMSGLEGEEGRRMGVRICEELLDSAMKYFNGIYLITPFLLYEMSVQLTQYVWEKSGRLDSHLYPLLK